MNTDLISYYSDRAKEYEKIYAKPERQEELKIAATVLKGIFINKKVFEICCGTGYWTERIAQTATSIFATDVNESMLEIARYKDYGKAKVSFGIADIYKYEPTEPQENLFGGFIWSHIQVQDLDNFLKKINGFVVPGATVVMMDNNFVDGSNHPIAYTDEEGNTFQDRKLEDGTTHRVRKNFPTENFLREKVESWGTEITIIQSTYFWILSYKTKNNQ